MSELNCISVRSEDDNADSREITEFVLEQAGAVVTSVSSGAEALRVLCQRVFDALISDVGMPEMDGYELIEKVRVLPAEHNGDVAAIALTAYAGDHDAERSLTAGFQRHLTKPVAPEALILTLRELIGA